MHGMREGLCQYSEGAAGGFGTEGFVPQAIKFDAVKRWCCNPWRTAAARGLLSGFEQGNCMSQICSLW